jgi:rRNA-processing protein FCF1
MIKAVVPDTNFFLIPGRKKRDVLGELQADGYSLIVLEPVHRELEKLAVGTSITAGAARIGLSLIKRKGLNTVPSSVRYADSAILAYCKQNGAVAATQDVALRQRLKSARVPVITLNRSGKLATEDTHVLQTQSTRPHSRSTGPLR